MKTIGPRLRKRREELGLTQEFCASRLGVSVLTIKRIEKGEHDTGFGTVVALCSLLQLTLPELLSEKEIGSIPFNELAAPAPSVKQALELVKNALKLADNPLIQRIAKLPAEELQELEKRIAMIEHRLMVRAERATKLSKKVE